MDIEALRAANLAKLMGTKAKKGPRVITAKSVAENTDDAWTVISLITKKEVIEGKDGKKRQGKNRRYADVFPIEDTVGVTASKNKNNELVRVKRTNIQTMRDMYSLRNKVTKFAIGEDDDTYRDYFKSLLDDVDAYAQMVVADMYEADPDLFDKVNQILADENEAMHKNLEGARDARS